MFLYDFENFRFSFFSFMDVFSTGYSIEISLVCL